jgi:hypothetical protein
MQIAAHGAYFVVPSGMQNYARLLARHMARSDLQFVPQSELNRSHFDGRRIADLVVDHAVTLTPVQSAIVEYVQPLIGRA